MPSYFSHNIHRQYLINASRWESFAATSAELKGNSSLTTPLSFCQHLHSTTTSFLTSLPPYSPTEQWSHRLHSINCLTICFDPWHAQGTLLEQLHVEYWQSSDTLLLKEHITCARCELPIQQAVHHVWSLTQKYSGNTDLAAVESWFSLYLLVQEWLIWSFTVQFLLN